ncbi:ABC transporter permease [Archaeoglobus sp.]
MKALTIAKKDILIYYSKGPVVIFGILLPIFLFLAFWIGRDLPLNFLMAGLIAMTVFFASTSVSPVIAPWEGQMKTLERLLTYPIDVKTIILGDIIASTIFGILLSAIPLAIAFGMGLPINPLIIVGIVISAFCFSSLGLLFSAYPSNIPATVMMISALIRFPMIFISGIFIPVDRLPFLGRLFAFLSPLTYFTDIARFCLGLKPFLPIYVDFAVLIGYTLLLFGLSVKLHEKSLLKRI